MVVEIDLDEGQLEYILSEFSEKELLNEYLDRIDSKYDISKIGVIAAANIALLFEKLDNINQQELEIFLNKY